MISYKSIQQSISTELDRLNNLIGQTLSTDNPLMNQVITAYLQQKGKQIRPIVVMLSARLFGEINDRTLAAAAAVELLHNASLIHDDVVDNAMMRRNVPTINAIWDNHIAVLVGDYFVSTAMQQAISTADVRIIDSLCYLGKLLSLGELDQIYNARYHTLTEEAYFRIINYKTASLFVACAKMGYFSINVDDSRLEQLSRFAELLGLCFQIRDDIFDYFTDERVGKPTGNDLKEGKITLPLLHVLLDQSLPESNEMRELSKKEQLSSDEIDLLMRYAVDNGGIEYAYQKMADLRAEACKLLDVFPLSPTRELLTQLFDSIISRDY